MTAIEQIRALNFLPFALHLTRIENLEGIFHNRGLQSRSSIGQTIFTDISDPSVQGVRARKTVPQTSRGLHDYVPFFLTFKAPMVAMRQAQNEDLVYIQVSLDIFTRISGCVLSDGNATNSITKFEMFDRADALKILDLGVLYKVSYAGDKERARKKAAELLVPDFVPISEFKSLIFYSDGGRDEGLSIIEKFGMRPAIKVLPGYFFGPRAIGTS